MMTDDDLKVFVGWDTLPLREYIGFCRRNPGHWRSPSTTDDHDLKLRVLQQECKKHGFDAETVSKALVTGLLDDQVDEESIEELSLQLLERVIEKRDLENAGKTQLVGRGLAMRDSLIKKLASIMVQNCTDDSLAPPQSLAVLISVQSGCDSKVVGTPRHMDAKRQAALFIANIPKISDRKVAAAVGVDHTSVSRWRKDPKFEEMISGSGNVANTEVLLDKLSQQSG